MKLVKAKDRRITEKDIKHNQIISERNKPPPKVIQTFLHKNYDHTQKTEDNEFLLRGTEDAFKEGLISEDIYTRTKKYLSSSSKSQPLSPQTATDKPIDSETGDFGSIRKAKNDTSQLDDIKAEKAIRLKNHLDKIECDLHEMNKKLTDVISKDIPAINDIKIQDGSTIPLEWLEQNSKDISELKKKEKNISDNITALDMIYHDGLITAQSYEQKKLHIEKNISDIHEAIMRTLEKEELDTLRARLEAEIKAQLSSGTFGREIQKYHEDLDSLQKIYDSGFISKEECAIKKHELNVKMNRSDEIISKIDAVFEEYKKELIKTITEKESNIRERSWLKEDPSAPQHLGTKPEIIRHSEKTSPGIISKIKSLFTQAEKKPQSVNGPVIDKPAIDNEIPEIDSGDEVPLQKIFSKNN